MRRLLRGVRSVEQAWQWVTARCEHVRHKASSAFGEPQWHVGQWGRWKIMQLVSVLQQQADDIRRRLDITDMVRAAKYEFQTYHGQVYWLVQDNKHHCTRLVHTGPADWNTGVPEGYQYICQVKWLGDYTWQEVTP